MDHNLQRFSAQNSYFLLIRESFLPQRFLATIVQKFAKFLEVNIQHSIRMRILFPFIAYTRDDLCRKLETIFDHSVKGAE
jgi:hypothetical protein